MKITPKDFATLEASLRTVDVPLRRKAYIDANLTTMRYQWDLVSTSGLMPWLCDTLYAYLNDDHIQTALNRIVKPL